jgi:predicted RNase H-like nuclease
MTLVAIGVDGARGGWIAARAFADGRTELGFFPSLERIAEWRGRADAPVAIDVPIGLMPLGGSRPCDFACRKQLPGRGSCVFPPPARFLVDLFPTAHVTPKQLRDAIFERATTAGPGAVPGLSAQSCGIFDKVWEADRFVRVGRRAEWVFEAHPELCFQRMRGAGLASKKTAQGVLQRLALVRSQFPDAEEQMREADHGVMDDLLDAYAALWTARRIAEFGMDGVEVLGDGMRDGPLPMRIVA